MKVVTLADASVDAKEAWLSLQKVWNNFWPSAMDFLIDLIIAIVVLLVGKMVIRFILKAVKKMLERSNADRGVTGFIQSLLKIGLYIILVIVIAGVLGIPTASLIALLGSAGLAIGLALQGSLANFAGGVLILILRPFAIGDFIETSSGSGIVSSVDIFYTKLNTGDNRVVIIPNGALSNSSITNVSKEANRRIDLVIGASHQNDMNQVIALLQTVSDELGEQKLSDKPTDIFVSNFAPNAIEYTYRVWVKAENYWNVRAILLKRVKEVFDANGITIPFNQMDVTIVKK